MTDEQGGSSSGEASIAIRRARPEDVDTLTALALRSKAHWGYEQELLELWRPDLEVDPEDLKQGCVLAAIDAEVIVGFCTVLPTATRLREPGRGELEALFVDPGWIGRGIGRQLMSEACELASARGLTSLEIWADPNAEAFYRAIGAVRVGSVSSKPPGRMLPLMVLELR